MATRSPPSDPLKLDRSDGSATLDLYRAVLGPMRRDYYLHAFTRFDAAGKAGLSWNWAAGLLTLNWMVFRQLWSAALAYAGSLTAGLLLCLGLGRLVFDLSEGGQWGLVALALLAAIAVPGALGNAWLYAACNRKMEAALRDSATLEEACARLARQASSSLRMALLGGANLALLAVLVAAAHAWPEGGLSSLAGATQPHLDSTAPVSGTVTPAGVAASGALPVSALAATSVAAAAAAATPPASAASSAASSAAASAPAAPTASAPALAASAAPPALVASAPAAAPAPAPVASAASKATAPPVARHTAAVAKATPHTASASAAKAHAGKTAAKLVKKASAPAADAASSNDSFVLNVGLFADENNARNAYTKLKDAGLPAQTQAMQFPKGPRTRVRVGPFATQAEAERAAEQVRALKLDAVLGKP